MQSAWLPRLQRAGRLAEDALLVLVLTSMVLLAAGQIVLRNFFGIGFIWGDEALRMLVLWIGVAGAVAASRDDRHINIAVLDRFLSGRWKAAKDLLIHFFTSAVCAVVTWHSFLFVRTSHEYGDLILGGLPAWIPQSVLPVGFALIAWRYALFTLRDGARLLLGDAASEAGE